MAAITWKTLAEPTFSDSGRRLAADLFGRVNTGLSGLITGAEATDTANWGQTKQNNTNEVLTQLMGAKSPEEFAAQEAQLKEQLLGFGAQVDGTAVRNAMDGRLATLQNRELASQQYTDQKTDIAERPAMAGYQGALVEARTPAGVQGLMESIRVANGANIISPKGFASLMKDALGRNDNLVNQGYAAENQELKKEDHVSQIANREHQQRIASANLRVQQNAANEARIARTAASRTAETNAVGANLTASAKLVAEMNEATKIAQANPYAKPIDTAIDSPMLGLIDTRFGGDKGQGAAVMEKVSGARFTVPVWSGEGKDRKITGYIPIKPPQAILDKAIANVSESWTDEIKPKWWVADNVVSEMRNLMNDEGEIGHIQRAQRTLGQAQDMGMPNKEAGVVPPAAPVPPADGAKAIINGAKAATAAPQGSSLVPNAFNMNMKTPKLKDNGDMVFSRNGFDFSTDRGVSAPKGIPMGALTTKALDGDTISITGEDGKTMKIRITGGDAQEIAHKGKEGQAGGAAGLEYLTNSLLNSGRTQLVFTDDRTDKNGRYIARLMVNGKDYTKAAIADGMMVPLDIGNSVGDQADNAALLKQAIREGKGMFNNKRDPQDILLPALNRASGQSRY